MEHKRWTVFYILSNGLYIGRTVWDFRILRNLALWKIKLAMIWLISSSEHNKIARSFVVTQSYRKNTTAILYSHWHYQHYNSFALTADQRFAVSRFIYIIEKYRSDFHHVESTSFSNPLRCVPFGVRNGNFDSSIVVCGMYWPLERPFGHIDNMRLFHTWLHFWFGSICHWTRYVEKRVWSWNLLCLSFS